MIDIDKLVRKNVRELSPYSSARDEFWGEKKTLLDANENPFPTEINRYPDPYQRKLKKQIASFKQCQEDQIFLGNGSDEIIDLMFRCFCEPGVDSVASLSPSYGMYRVTADIHNVKINKYPLGKDFKLDASELLSNMALTDKIVFICNPNNPTGNTFSKSEIFYLINNFPGIVVIDEAYFDFSNATSYLFAINENNNLVILQTFSKAWGGAGMRLGMGFMHSSIVKYLNKLKLPYNINSLTQLRASELLADTERYFLNLNKIKEQRKWLKVQLRSCPVVEKVYPSQANFLLVRFYDHEKVYDELIKQNIVVRNRHSAFMCENCLRLTIGTGEENMKMVEIIKSIKNQ